MASHIQNALIQSPYSSPDIQYKVSYTATRIDNSNVRYDFTIHSLLQGYSQTNFKTGKILNCTITVGGISNSVTLKDRSEVWSGGSGGTTGEGTVHSTEYISIICPSSSGGEWQTITFNVTRGDSGGNSGKVSTSDYYVISPDLLWTGAGGATVDYIIDNGDNTITVTCTMGADGYNNAVYNVHIYGFVDRSDGIPSYGDHDFSASDGSVSGRTVTFTIPAPSSKSSYMVRICAYSISQKGDNPRGYPVNSDTIYRRYTNTICHWKYVGTGGESTNGTHTLMGTSTFTATYGQSVTIPSNLVQSYTGYYNTGVANSLWGTGAWSTKNIGSTFTQPSFAINIEYYYEPKTIKLTFDPNGGTLPNPGNNLYQENGPNPENKVTIPYNERMYAVMPNDIPTRSGYIFDGWNTESDGSGTQVYGADGLALKEGTYYNSEERWVYPGDVTLYAQWLSDNNIKIKVNGEWLTGNICWIKIDEGIWEQADSINEILKDSI